MIMVQRGSGQRGSGQPLQRFQAADDDVTDDVDKDGLYNAFVHLGLI